VVAAGDIASADIKTMTNVNYIAPAIIMSAVADTMETNTSTIIVISSVAGDRGRKSNYIYGSAKAALSSFASGLRNRYFGKIHVMTVKPGFLDTPMTYGMNSKLIFNKDKAAKIILNAAAKKVDVLYVPFFWRYIMLIIKTIPEIVFKRLNL
jgi:short-subunit dehydrogenase